MASRKQSSLGKTASLVDGGIRFSPAERDPSAEWLWLDLANSMGQEDVALAFVAGQIGQLNSTTASPVDAIALWEDLRRQCVELMRGLLQSRKHVFESEVSASLWLRFVVSDPWGGVPIKPMGDLLNEWILAGDVRLTGPLPLQPEGLTIAGKVLAQGFREASVCTFLSECSWCGRLFTSSTARPRRHCSSACRKATHNATLTS
jgi:hypothetical protein